MEAGPVSGAVVGRFAPSPSGRLHLGNLACSLLAWLSAKSQGGRIVLRIEDLDAERCPRIYADLLEQDLAWLGLVWDEGGSTGGPHGPYYQSECADIYTGQYKKLEAQGLVYPCFCSRAQLHAASAPHTSDGNVIYPGTCRDLTAAQIAEKRKKKAPAYRVRVPDEEITFLDGCMGPHTENLLRDCGDFYLRRADGVFAYQLAVSIAECMASWLTPISTMGIRIWRPSRLPRVLPPATSARLAKVCTGTPAFSQMAVKAAPVRPLVV